MNPSFGEGLFNLRLSPDLSGKIPWNYLTMSSSRSKPSFTFFEVIWSSFGFLASFLFSREIGSSVWKPCDPVLRLVFFREIFLGLFYHIVVKLWFKIQNFWRSFEWILSFCPKPSRAKIHEKSHLVWKQVNIVFTIKTGSYSLDRVIRFLFCVFLFILCLFGFRAFPA